MQPLISQQQRIGERVIKISSKANHERFYGPRLPTEQKKKKRRSLVFNLLCQLCCFCRRGPVFSQDDASNEKIQAAKESSNHCQ